MVLVAGDAGIGKTALARALADAGRDARARPLGRVRPAVDAAAARPVRRPRGRVPAARCRRSSRARAARTRCSRALRDDAVRRARRRDHRGRALGRPGDARRAAPARAPHRVAAGAGRGHLPRGGGRRRRRAAGRARRPLRRRGRLAPDARAALARRGGDARGAAAASIADELYRRTAGNPFYVTEVIEAGDAAVPADRARRRPRARRPPRHGEPRSHSRSSRRLPPAAESWLLEAVCGDCAEAVAAGLSAGMLVANGDAIGFRHEIAREAVERWIAPQRAAGAAPQHPRGARDGTRPGSGAARASRGAAPGTTMPSCATRRRPPSAPRPSAHTARPPPSTDGRCARRATCRQRSRAALHELRAEALYAADDQVESIADLYEAIALTGRQAMSPARPQRHAAARSAAGVPRSDGRGARGRASRRRAARSDSRAAGVRRSARRARACPPLRGRPRRRDRGRAARHRHRQRRSATRRRRRRGDHGRLRRDAARRAERPAVARDGTRDRARGRRRSADTTGAERPRLRARSSTAHSIAERWIEEGLAYTDGHDLDLWRLSILSYRMWSELHRGCWDDATDTADELLGDLRDSPGPTRRGAAGARGRARTPRRSRRCRRRSRRLPGCRDHAEATWCDAARVRRGRDRVAGRAAPSASAPATEAACIAAAGANRPSGRAPSSPSGAIEPGSASIPAGR